MLANCGSERHGSPPVNVTGMGTFRLLRPIAAITVREPFTSLVGYCFQLPKPASQSKDVARIPVNIRSVWHVSRLGDKGVTGTKEPYYEGKRGAMVYPLTR